MQDSRYTKLAHLLVHYSLGVSKGDLILLSGESGGMPLLEALYVELIKKGAHVKIALSIAGWDELFYAHASDEQLQHTSPFAEYEVATCSKRIKVLAPTNTRSLTNVDSRKQMLVSKANRPILSKVMERSAKGEMEWLVTLCPTFSAAQEAEMGFREYEDFVFRAGLIDADDPLALWKAQEKAQEKMIHYLSDKKQLSFKTPQGTDLEVNVEGMRWINSCGKRNFPDGEVFTGPNLKAKDGGVNGVVKYTYPAVWQNTLVEDVELIFEKGEVVSAKASKNESFLNAVIHQDEGAKRFGEIAIGTNYHIKQFTKEILFDEKIGGTFHAALGAGYPETGNTNESALHWDMICDLREGGTIEADGELISKDGVFLFPDWPS